MSKFDNLNVMPNKLVAQIVANFGRVKIVYLTTNGTTEDPNDPNILGTFYAASNLPDGVIAKLAGAIRAIDGTQVLTIPRTSMGNNIKRGYGLFGEGPPGKPLVYKFNNTVHEGLVIEETQDMIRVMSDWLGTDFNSVLVNSYTGTARISPHSDNEKCLASLLNIPGLSVAPRNPLPGCDYQFIIRTVGKDGVRAKTVYKYTFPPICLFGMYGPDFQTSFTHAVPGGPDERERRVSLTFRSLTHLTTSPKTKSSKSKSESSKTPKGPKEGRKRKVEEHEAAAEAGADAKADNHVAKK